MLSLNLSSINIMWYKLKVFALCTIVGLSITSCAAQVPSPFATGSTYKGWVNSRSAGIEIVWPWAFLLDND